MRSIIADHRLPYEPEEGTANNMIASSSLPEGKPVIALPRHSRKSSVDAC
jgi:hypothetical protein